MADQAENSKTLKDVQVGSVILFDYYVTMTRQQVRLCGTVNTIEIKEDGSRWYWMSGSDEKGCSYFHILLRDGDEDKKNLDIC